MRSATQLRRVPCQERGERRVSDLLDAAESVIAEAGYEGATMCAIAERAGAAIGSLYQFFPSKAAIAQALCHRYGKQFDEMCAPLAEQAKSLHLQAFVNHLIDLTAQFVNTHPAFFPLLDAPRSVRSSPAIRKLLQERFVGFLLAQKPRLSMAKAVRLSTVTLQILKAMNELYRELAPEQRPAFTQEFKMVLYSYLNARLDPGSGKQKVRQ
jgi:AcrR family transcriptional regulator